MSLQYAHIYGDRTSIRSMFYIEWRLDQYEKSLLKYM